MSKRKPSEPVHKYRQAGTPPNPKKPKYPKRNRSTKVTVVPAGTPTPPNWTRK